MAATGDELWIAQGSRISRTVDGGEHWEALNDVDGEVTSMTIAPPSRAWVGTNNGVFRSENAGSSWPSIAPGNIDRVRFVDSEHGWYSDADLKFFRTSDGGASWQQVTLVCPLFAFVDASSGWSLCGGPAGGGASAKQLFSTADGGVTWTLIGAAAFGIRMQAPLTLPSAGYPRDLFLYDSDTAFIAESRSGVDSTYDGGRSWINTADPKVGSTDTVDTVVYVTDQRGYLLVGSAPTTRRLLATTDAGVHWQPIPTP